MKRHTKFVTAGMTAAMLTVFCLTGCGGPTEEQKQAAEKYRSEAETWLEGNNYTKAQEAMEKALEQIPEDEELQAAAEEINKKAEEMKGYNETMEAARAAMEADDAAALDALQESEAGQALVKMAKDTGSYIYLPEGGTSGTGIGFYTFDDCDCDQWYYGDYQEGRREGNGIWYYASSRTEDGSLYKEVYNGQWSQDAPNGKGHQLIALGDTVDTDQDFDVENGLFYGTYDVKDTLEDGTEVTGKYELQNGKYVTISDEELEANNFVVPEEPHLAIAFLYNEAGEIKSCTMVYTEDTTRGVKHFY
ncbi:hypothetical protein C805_01584 [Eubacterium sp. 14-2]|uniref:hypothetical protein n=1 Tax=Eubacterium sp. 14-2 TaxID=1235790 RepID=UPI000337196E|nr:hypothetical protein [Eubacterium sp. 14-2]EOT27476.1 hypothetical protein C805_01584 [Eubacterium sp. 14-2]